MGVKSTGGPDTELVGINTLQWPRTELVKLPKEALNYASQACADGTEGGYAFLTSTDSSLATVQNIDAASPKVSGKGLRLIYIVIWS